MKFAIDAGHGGKDPGAVGPTGLEEAGVNLNICKRIHMHLADMRQQVVLTRSEDVFVDLSRRCQIANDWQADFFVSVHCNSDGPTAVGVETLYKTEYGEALAAPIQDILVDSTSDRDRGLKHRDDLAVLNGTDMPAVLVEVGFISHPETEQKLRDPIYLETIAKSIVAGIAEHIDFVPPKAD